MLSCKRKSNRRALMLTALVLLTAPALATEQGFPAPAFDLSGTNGAVKLAGYSGKVVYLDFWASWCGPCKQSFPWMNEIQSKYGAQGLQIVGVNLDEKSEDVHRFLKNTPANFAVAFDSTGATPKAYGVKGMPTSFLIGRDGKVFYQHTGFRAADRAELEKKIQAALEAK